MPAPERKVKQIEMAGKSGSLLETDDTYSDIEIPIEMNFIIPPDLWGQRFRIVKRWLLGKAGELKFSDDSTIFYMAKNVTIENTERTVREGGEFTANFLCDPYTFLVAGKREHTASEVQYNPYSLSHPTYKITGEGMCTLTVNGKTMTANVGQNLTIDTDRMIAYRQDGTLQNTAVTGDYEDLYLQEGDNTIAITTGFGLSVIPNWRCL